MKISENASEEKYNMIVTYAPVPLAEVDESGKIHRMNIMGQKLLDPLFATYRLSNANLFPLLDQICPDICALIKNFNQPGGRITFNEIQSFCLPPPAAQNKRYFQYNINKIFKGCIMVGIDDLTQRYEEEKAMQQHLLDQAVAQAKFEMAAEMLHDIGNALTGLSSYQNRLHQILNANFTAGLAQAVQFLQEQQPRLEKAIGDRPSKALVDLLESIDQVADENNIQIRQITSEQQHIITHIQDILSIHRQYISGYPSQERKPVNLNELIQDSCTMVEASCLKKGIKLRLHLAETAPPVKGDRVKLMQVMLNILRNSIEAINEQTPEKIITVTLGIDNNAIAIVVRDTGEGLDPLTIPHLFERGYTTKSSGSGLGLYNCRSIIESHRGTIDITSGGIGKGTQITICFAS